ncbi:MAG TPA: nitronate monooxygenase [Candidatus Merdicola faecigallinarum]|uniref:Probable nitronate monooxygenase n=1 Tax=Candidatus Merdicola faecigallinarum TaxID=2840862 RepID=A0A9D1S9E0_9FIRM|nr:nitronate monooxygenase [Candidatus Merdicola faecigallinarum]
MNIEGLKIGEKISKYPIIQGGMGVGVSGYRLAGNVAKEGGIGIISTADIGYRESDFETNPVEANLRAIDKEIDEARKISPDGILGINIMCALNNYAEMVREVVKKGIDLIISGAGLPKELPEFVKGTKTKIAPIISSARAAKLITKLWRTKHNYVPDMIVIEGPEAGGHLGFKLEELQEEKKPKLEDITKEVIEEMKKVEEETGKKIPVVVAGGIFDGKDIAKFLKLGASGVQMATRFVTTKECDAAEEFKKAYINSKKEDIEIVSSPVGMPGRAIRNTFIEKVKQERPKITKCLKCIQTCDVKTTPYCITRALINAVKGNMENALIFCGSNAYRLKEIVSVHELMQELVQETKQCMV